MLCLTPKVEGHKSRNVPLDVRPIDVELCQIRVQHDSLPPDQEDGTLNSLDWNDELLTGHGSPDLM